MHKSPISNRTQHETILQWAEGVVYIIQKIFVAVFFATYEQDLVLSWLEENGLEKFVWYENPRVLRGGKLFSVLLLFDLKEQYGKLSLSLMF